MLNPQKHVRSFAKLKPGDVVPPKRDHVLTIRLTKGQNRTVAAAAKQHGVSLNAFALAALESAVWETLWDRGLPENWMSADAPREEATGNECAEPVAPSLTPEEPAP